ncbi:MAG: PucR family transcriptional regulator [Pseudomonadota bacterium]
MTKLITRYFDSVDRARTARKDLIFIRQFSDRIVHLYESEEEFAQRRADFTIDSATADAYARRLASGGAVLLVEAGYRPLSAAQTTRNVAAELGAADMGDLVEEVLVPDSSAAAPSIYLDHRYILSRRREPGNTNYFMANWPIPLISRRKPVTFSLVEPHARMADKILPLISDSKPYTFSLIDDHARMANWPIGLISKRKPFDGFAFPRHARMADKILPLLSKRKPYTGSIIDRHARMANWPFPHLINGKTGTNALMPGAPRMANFPIPLLSGRKPYDESIFDRHARMANFPFGLISKRKPITASIFPRHARMANFILPLVIRSSPHSKGFWLSRLFGWPTLSRR